MSSNGMQQISIRDFDTGAARSYLAELRSLITEAIETSDPRVLRVALAVMGRQTATVRELFGEVAERVCNRS
jgi:hypothetical protein